MKHMFTFFLLFNLIGIGCNSRLPEISQKQVNLDLSKGTLFEPSHKVDLPFLIILDNGENRIENWRKTAVKIAQSGYRVLITNTLSKTWANKVEKSTANHSLKTAILGVGKMAEQVLLIAATDTTIGAVITLDAATSFQYSDSTFAKIAPRPHLILETAMTPQTPDQAKLDFFNASFEPKKLVWLATKSKGSNIVNSDLEPIVRRTVLMLIDRYLKGKM